MADSTYAWLQPDGSWGYSNAGLVSDGGRSLLIDTLFDLKLTGEMLQGMRRLTRGHPIETLVNTHANGDDCWGNQLVAGAEIVASEACAQELMELEPGVLATLLGSDQLGEVGEYLRRAFSAFDIELFTYMAQLAR